MKRRHEVEGSNLRPHHTRHSWWAVGHLSTEAIMTPICRTSTYVQPGQDERSVRRQLSPVRVRTSARGLAEMMESMHTPALPLDQVPLTEKAAVWACRLILGRERWKPGSPTWKRLRAMSMLPRKPRWRMPRVTQRHSKPDALNSNAPWLPKRAKIFPHLISMQGIHEFDEVQRGRRWFSPPCPGAR